MRRFDYEDEEERSSSIGKPQRNLASHGRGQVHLY